MILKMLEVDDYNSDDIDEIEFRKNQLVEYFIKVGLAIV